MTDPYFSTKRCVDRLWKEYSKHKRLIVCVDYDDTIADFHVKGYQYTRVINLLKECSELGFIITIYTAGKPERWPGMIEHLESQFIIVSSINKNAIDLPYGLWGKLYYNVLLCDRSGLPHAYKVLNRLIGRVKGDSFRRWIKSLFYFL